MVVPVTFVASNSLLVEMVNDDLVEVQISSEEMLEDIEDEVVEVLHFPTLPKVDLVEEIKIAV